ncbi:MAG: hypothetical protein ACYCW6_05460 [Candidatus Xenobia bacterium]
MRILTAALAGIAGGLFGNGKAAAAFQTRGGVHIGSTSGQMIQEFGSAQTVQEPSRLVRLEYASRGIIFQLQDDRVMLFNVVPPR